LFGDLVVTFVVIFGHSFKTEHPQLRPITNNPFKTLNPKLLTKLTSYLLCVVVIPLCQYQPHKWNTQYQPHKCPSHNIERNSLRRSSASTYSFACSTFPIFVSCYLGNENMSSLGNTSTFTQTSFRIPIFSFSYALPN